MMSMLRHSDDDDAQTFDDSYDDFFAYAFDDSYIHSAAWLNSI